MTTHTTMYFAHGTNGSPLSLTGQPTGVSSCMSAAAQQYKVVDYGRESIINGSVPSEVSPAQRRGLVYEAHLPSALLSLLKSRLNMAPSDMEEMLREASERYAKKSGKRLEDLPKPQSTDELMQQVKQANQMYKGFRAKQEMLFKILAAAMKPVELVGDLAAGVASAVFPASRTVFGAAMYLINTAKGVSASLNAIAGLMEDLKGFTIRLNVYNKAMMSKELTEQLIETLASSSRPPTRSPF
jgi:hypothetical protein